MTGTVTILRADARALPIPDASVDLVVTSPPYFALRSYQDGGEHYGEQIGAEPTPREYIAALIDCTREWMRVLKPGGSIFVNLGDKYSTHYGTTSGHVGVELGITDQRKAAKARDARANRRTGIPEKSLMLLPERYRVAAVDELGLIARAVVIWSKPNGLPESVTDRVRRSHEDWVHLTKQPRYYSAVDEIREQATTAGKSWDARKAAGEPGRNRGGSNGNRAGIQTPPTTAVPSFASNPLGKLPGSVWEIATEPLKVPAELGIDHFAAFPTEWPRRIILGWSPSGICVECGEGRRPVATKEKVGGWVRGTEATRRQAESSTGGERVGTLVHDHVRVRIAGEECACPAPIAPTRQSVVLDPFGGTGTTALVAMVLGRHGISGDRSADYCRLARWRTTDPGQLAKAMRVPPPAAVHREQMDLFGGAA